MPGHESRLLFLLCAVMLCPARADDRFYQIVDPEGHVRIMKAPSGESAPVAVPKEEPKEVSPVAPPAVAPAAPPAAKAATPDYDSDAYLDSEVLESSGFNPEKKKHFYIINDGSGSHIQENNAGMPSMSMDEVPTKADALVSFTELPDEFLEVSGQELADKFAPAGLCFSAKQVASAPMLPADRAESLLIDERTLRFVRTHGVLAAYRVQGQGIRTVTVRSYSRHDVNPAYVRPYLAVAGADGCISRMLTGYFQRQYEATQSRHAMLEAGITMHASESYLLVIVPDAPDRAPNDYSLSRYGQLSIKWQP